LSRRDGIPFVLAARSSSGMLVHGAFLAIEGVVRLVGTNVATDVTYINLQLRSFNNISAPSFLKIFFSSHKYAKTLLPVPVLSFNRSLTKISSFCKSITTTWSTNYWKAQNEEKRNK
jgi:hypothetical protein